MTTSAYHYLFNGNVSIDDVQDSLQLSILAMECLHGAAQTRLELVHCFDRVKRSCTIGCATELGRDLNCLFTGFLNKEFGPSAFTVQQTCVPVAERAA